MIFVIWEEGEWGGCEGFSRGMDGDENFEIILMLS